MNSLFQKPKDHPAREWINRIGAQRYAVAARLGIHYSYLSGILCSHVSPTPVLEEKLQAIISECQKIYEQRNGKTPNQK